MRHLITFALLGIAALVLLCGCPRDTGGDTGAAMVPPSATDATGDTSHGEPVATDTSGGEQDATSGKGGMPATDETAATDETTDETATDGELAADHDGDTAEQNELGDEMSTEQTTEETITVVFETTKGDIVLEVHPSWSPLGAAHFIELVEAGFYDGAPWFRVFDDPGGISVAQCGFAADPQVTAQWMYQTINDEPVIQGNATGTVAFGKSSAPNSRSTHIFVNMADNSFALDQQGFSCFAKVAEGMDVVQRLHRTGAGALSQGELAQRGIEYFKQVAPEGDVIKRAYVK